jgi:hypothetical protein
VTQKRKDRGVAPSISQTAPVPVPPAAAEAPTPAAQERPGERGPLFWRLFGVAAVAVVAVVGVATFQHVQCQICAQRRELTELNNELHKDMTHLGDSYAQMVKKDDEMTRLRSVWDTLKELRADRSDLTVMKERCAQLAEAYRASEEERRALAAEVRRLRESKTADDERSALVAEIRGLRERIAQVEGKPKAGVVPAGHSVEQQEP